MLVVVQGDLTVKSCTVLGLDILAPRHPKLHNLVIGRLGFQTLSDSQVVVNLNGEVGEGCQPDTEGRQLVLRCSLYPTDVVNILTETGGFTVTSTTSRSDGEIVWSLVK